MAEEAEDMELREIPTQTLAVFLQKWEKEIYYFPVYTQPFCKDGTGDGIVQLLHKITEFELGEYEWPNGFDSICHIPKKERYSSKSYQKSCQLCADRGFRGIRRTDGCGHCSCCSLERFLKLINFDLLDSRNHLRFKVSNRLISVLFRFIDDTDDHDPLISYAVGLLATAFQFCRRSSKLWKLFQDENAILMPVILKRLWLLQEEMNNQDPSPKSDEAINISEYPFTKATEQTLILHYLTCMGEYSEFLEYACQDDALQLIMNYIDNAESQEKLATEATKYLAALLFHEKVALEFIAIGGLEKLMAWRLALHITPVSFCLYSLACCDGAMEIICALPKQTITQLVSYALWMVKSPDHSCSFHAMMFFSHTFKFRTILDEFDAQGGLRILYDIMRIFPVVLPAQVNRPWGHFFLEDLNNVGLTDARDQCFYMQAVRHTTVALRRYFEAHLAIKHEFYTRMRSGRPSTDQPANKGQQCSPEDVQMQIETLLELMPWRDSWPCVDRFISLNGMELLLQTIAYAYKEIQKLRGWCFETEFWAESTESALAVLCVCCVRPSARLVLCEQLELDNVPHQTPAGLHVVLECFPTDLSIHDDIETDIRSELQMHALWILITCLTPPPDMGPQSRDVQCDEDNIILEKFYDTARKCHAIMTLKDVILDRPYGSKMYEVRTLACRAMSGLLRCEKVCEIVRKLSVLINNRMHDVLATNHEDRMEHMLFQRHYFELILPVFGNIGPEISLDSIIGLDALCSNTSCAHFNHLLPHKCPELKPPPTDALTNFNMRLLKKQSDFRVSSKSSSMDINLLTRSRFYQSRSNRDYLNINFTYCQFIPINSGLLALGLESGHVALCDVNNLKKVHHVHEAHPKEEVYHIEWNRAESLMLTSANAQREGPSSALWTISSDSKMISVYRLRDYYAEFSKTSQVKILGSQHDQFLSPSIATVYDTETGRKIQDFAPRLVSSHYLFNRATFNHTDQLVLSNGVLFDVRSGKAIYHFDMLDPLITGVFHPNGLEILKSMEVWDLRTFKLRLVVPRPHHEAVFSPIGNVIYAFQTELPLYTTVDYTTALGTSFTTIDSRDYSIIGTTDTGMGVGHLAVNSLSSPRLAVVHRSPGGRFDSEPLPTASFSLYDIGPYVDQDQ